MPTATRTFRVFVSSTFEDLKAERDALQRVVFPRLRKLCEANNVRFQAIYLRWGVRDMEICLRISAGQEFLRRDSDLKPPGW